MAQSWDYEEGPDEFTGDVNLELKAYAYNVRRLLRKRGGPRGKDWFIVGQYLMNSGVLNDYQVAELAWKAQDYEEAPPFGDQAGMVGWDEAQAAREALKRTAKKVLKMDMEVRGN